MEGMMESNQDWKPAGQQQMMKLHVWHPTPDGLCHPLSWYMKHTQPLWGTDTGLLSAYNVSRWKSILLAFLIFSGFNLYLNFTFKHHSKSAWELCADGFLETLCQLPQPRDCFISHDCKTSHQYTKMIPDSAASWRCRLVLLDHRSSCLCAPLWVNLVKWFLGDHFRQGTLKTLPAWAVPKRIDKSCFLSTTLISLTNTTTLFTSTL